MAQLEQAAKTFEMLLNKVPGDPNLCSRLGTHTPTHCYGLLCILYQIVFSCSLWSSLLFYSLNCYSRVVQRAFSMIHITNILCVAVS
jgi:hypothetical protein